MYGFIITRYVHVLTAPSCGILHFLLSSFLRGDDAAIARSGLGPDLRRELDCRFTILSS